MPDTLLAIMDAVLASCLLRRCARQARKGAQSAIKPAPGAYADLLLVDGNPLEDIALLEAPEENLAVIMKDGVIYKNEL